MKDADERATNGVEQESPWVQFHSVQGLGGDIVFYRGRLNPQKEMMVTPQETWFKDGKDQPWYCFGIPTWI